MNFTKSAVILITALGASSQSIYAAATVDKDIKAYKKVSGVSGNVTSVGSDTLANLMTLWSESFRRLYPNVEIRIQAAGSSTAPPALTQGTSNLGPMSRKMKNKEWQSFEKKHGYKPLRIRVAIDALAVFVHKDNPIKGLSIPQVDAIFSATLKCGHNDNLLKWGQLGMTGSWKNRKIQLFGRNSVSGTYGYFKKKALCKGDYKTNVAEQPGSSSVVQSVSTNISGIGYSGIGYKTPGVRALALTKKPGQKFIAATSENAITGKYPLARFLYVYVNKKPGKPLPIQVRQFLTMILSAQGQKVVVKDGYIPLPKKVLDAELAKLK